MNEKLRHIEPLLEYSIVEMPPVIRMNDSVRYLGGGEHALQVGRISHVASEDGKMDQFTICFPDGSTVNGSDYDVILSSPYVFQFGGGRGVMANTSGKPIFVYDGYPTRQKRSAIQRFITWIREVFT